MPGRRATWLLAGVLMVTATACGSQPAMTRTDARTFARQALVRVGFTGVTVDRTVTLASYRSPDPKFRTQKPVAVWQTHSTIDGQGSVDLYVPRKGNSAVFVRDEATAGGPLLTDRQFKLLRDFRLNPAANRRSDRIHGPKVAAIILLVLVGAAALAAAVSSRTQPRPPPPRDETPLPPEPASVL
ncbi:MAG: hypothetical protein JO086_04935 [Acidimicrobiia bacterium]|nr:hypothetical protein [Acidimicrobiia bacterium]